MILSGKTIGQLALSTGITSNSLFAIEQSGKTFHIPYSGLSTGGGTYEEVTYDELYSLYTGGTLVPGGYYLITDFQTCYDQPDFDYNGFPITGVNTYHVATIDPILVLAVSGNTLSPFAFQPSYPNDKIQYDITWNVTEATGNPAKGRITERIDEFNNRTDYDHRTILFKRYDYIEFVMQTPLQGTVDVNIISPTLMTVTGTGTFFTSSLIVGSYVGFGKPDNYKAYQVVSISGDTEMEISGLTNFSGFGIKIYQGNIQTDILYYQNNVSTAFTEYFTFDYTENNINNYVGNVANSYQYEGLTFLLANNVFKGFDFINNKFGNMCYNNTFDDDCTNNIIGNYFYNNSTDDDFDENLIGNYFNSNRITSNFNNNRIGEYFESNYIVENSFYRNNIGNFFNSNLIDGGDFQNNEIGNNFQYNNILNGQFYKNDIGNGYNNNNTYSSVYGNLIGNAFNYNTIYCQIGDNQISEYFGNNIIGDSNSFGNFGFYENRIGINFQSNLLTVDFYNNNILNGFQSNNINTKEFRENNIMNFFQNNIINSDFNKNQIGNGFLSNNISTNSNFTNNIIGNDFLLNSIHGLFFDNEIGNNFATNILGDSGTPGNYSFQKNKVYSDFGNNQLTGTTQFNEFGFSFNNNTNNSTNSLQKNKFTNGVASTDFSTATHVFGYYDCNIYQRPDGNFKLSYYDDFDVLNITNITS